jgi:ANTAR domain
MSAERHNDDDDGWANLQQQVSREVHEILERRVVIEQTKGMLMLLYGVDADTAFDMLRSQSQRHNVKLYLIAEQIHGDLVELFQAQWPARRFNTDRVVLAAHQRVAHIAARQMDGQSKTG